jgi:two-component system, cell cycle sensor histidine kinase and response regulator CckA
MSRVGNSSAVSRGTAGFRGESGAVHAERSRTKVLRTTQAAVCGSKAFFVQNHATSLAMIARGVQLVTRLAEPAPAGVGGGGSFAALVAVMLAGGFGALAMLSSGAAEPLVLAVMALLATIGVFFLFGIAAGHIRIGDTISDQAMVNAVVDTLADGAIITSVDSSVIWANKAAEALLGRADSGRLYSIAETFGGEPRAAEALFRLSRAIKNGERREEVIMSGTAKRSADGSASV